MSQPVPIKLFSPTASRDGTVLKDSRLINGIAEKSQEGDEVWIMRRPCLVPYQGVGAGVGQGVYNWKNDLYAIFGGRVWKNGVILAGAVDATGIYTFTSSLGATPRLFFQNGSSAYVYDDGGGIVQVVDTDYPAATVPGCAYLDGTTYVLDSLNNIHGSDFNDQSSWDPLNVIVAQITPDMAVALAKQLVYVIALKQVSMEVFHDAGNAVGSPLAPVQGSKGNVGCRAAGTVCDVSGDLAWVGTTSGGSVKVMLMSRVKPQDISSPPVERLLAECNFTTAWSWSMELPGHQLYVVTLPLSNLTLAFDTGNGTWYIWTDADGNYLPIVSATFDRQARSIVQHASNGFLYEMSSDAFQDDQGPVQMTLHTPNWDGGLRTEKTCSTIELVADRSAGIVDVSWSDDDYQTFTSPQSVTLDQDRPMLDDGSTFRSRSWKFSTVSNARVRIKRLEATLTGGTF